MGAKNEAGTMSQQDFFRIFLVSVQNSLTTNQRLAGMEKRLEETDSRLDKIEVVGNAASEAPIEEVVEAEEPAESPPEEETPEESAEEDITTQVENVEKKRTSRKRAQKESGTQREGRAKRARV